MTGQFPYPSSSAKRLPLPSAIIVVVVVIVIEIPMAITTTFMKIHKSVRAGAFPSPDRADYAAALPYLLLTPLPLNSFDNLFSAVR
jgi:hypothetical protein